MSLGSTQPSQAIYFEAPAIMLDTSAIIWISDARGLQGLDLLLSTFAVLIPTPAIYETAFGPREMVSPGQKNVLDRLTFEAQKAWTNTPYSYEILRRAGQIRAGAIHVINPTINEWESSRNRLVARIQTAGGNYRKGKLKHSLDSLIYSCARNNLSPLCTENIEDFEKLNVAANRSSHDHAIPLFTTRQVFDAVDNDVRYIAPLS